MGTPQGPLFSSYTLVAAFLTGHAHKQARRESCISDGVLGGQVHLLEERGVARVAFDALQKRVAFKLRETAVA